MNLQGIARVYTTIVEIEERARVESPSLSEDLSIVRADLHALLMEALREAGISFTDRGHAARIAFDMTRAKTRIA